MLVPKIDSIEKLMETVLTKGEYEQWLDDSSLPLTNKNEWQAGEFDLIKY